MPDNDPVQSVIPHQVLRVARRVTACLLLSCCSKTSAHDQIPGSPQSQPIAVIGGVVHPVDAADIPNGCVLFADGKIKAVGSVANIELPTGTRRIDAAGKHVYPGLIAGLSDIGLREIATIASTVDSVEVGSVNPNVRSWVAFNPDSELIPVARANGVLTAMVAPTGERIQGQCAVMSLDGWSVADMSLMAPAGLCLAWESLESTDRVDKSRIEARESSIQAIDDLFDQAKRYELAGAFGKDAVLESLLPVLHGKLPLVVEANRKSAIESVVAFAAARNLKVVIYGGYDADQCADLLIKRGVPVIVPGTFRSPLYRHDPYDAAYSLPAKLTKAGVKYCISGERSGYPGGATNLRNLPYQAARAVAHGLPASDALRAITLSAAEIIGVGDRIGSLSADKDATLMIVDGDILETASHVTQAWVQGREVDLGNRHRSLSEKYEKKYAPAEAP